MVNQDQYSQAVARYAGQLRYMYTPVADPALEGLEAPIDPAEILARRAEDLAGASADLGLRTIDFLKSDDMQQREGAEMKLLTQIAADLEIAGNLLTAVQADVAGQGVMEAANSPMYLASRTTVEQLAFTIEQPLDAGMMPFLFDARYRQLPPMNATGAGLVLQREAAHSLERISRRAARTVATAGSSLLHMDMDTLRQGVSLISQEVAELIEGIATDFRAAARRLIQAALRLMLQAFDWVLALLGQDAETLARQRVRRWLDEIQDSRGQVREDYVYRLINRIFTPEVYSREIAAWIEQTNAGMQALVDATEIVRSLAERYEKKTEYVEKALRILSVVGLLPLPIARVPQFQVALAAIMLGLMGYTIFTGYDHSDSGSIYFLQRFRIPIPDRVTGVRRTVQQALGVAEPPLRYGLSEPPFTPGSENDGDVPESETDAMAPAPEVAPDTAGVADSTWE